MVLYFHNFRANTPVMYFGPRPAAAGHLLHMSRHAPLNMFQSKLGHYRPVDKKYFRNLCSTIRVQGCLVLVGQDIEVDAVGRQFEPYTAGPLWCDLGCCSQTVLVLKLRRRSAFYTLDRPNNKGTQATQGASDQFRTKTPPHKQRPLSLLVSGLIERWSFQGSVSKRSETPPLDLTSHHDDH